MEKKAKLGDSIEIQVLNENPIIKAIQIGAKGFYNLSEQTRLKVEGAYNLPLPRRPKIDLSKRSGKNLLDRLVRLMQKLAKSVTKISSKIREFKTYN